MNNMDEYTQVTIEDMVELIRIGEHSIEVLYEDAPYPNPNIITLICEDKYCNDVREFKPIISSHSPAQIYIRSHDKDKVVTAWKEFFIHSVNIYSAFKVTHTANKLNVEIRSKDHEFQEILHYEGIR